MFDVLSPIHIEEILRALPESQQELCIPDNLIEFFCRLLYRRVGGVPRLINASLTYLIDQIRENKVSLREETNIFVALGEGLRAHLAYYFPLLDPTKTTFTYPNTSSPEFKRFYGHLIILSALGIPFSNKSIALEDYGLQEVIETKEKTNVAPLLTILEKCNVYFAASPSKEFRDTFTIVFPEIVLDTLLLECKDRDLPFYIAQYKSGIRSEEPWRICEEAVAVFLGIRLNTILSTTQTWGSHFPWLQETPLKGIYGRINSQKGGFLKFPKVVKRDDKAGKDDDEDDDDDDDEGEEKNDKNVAKEAHHRKRKPRTSNEKKKSENGYATHLRLSSALFRDSQILALDLLLFSGRH